MIHAKAGWFTTRWETTWGRTEFAMQDNTVWPFFVLCPTYPENLMKIHSSVMLLTNMDPENRKRNAWLFLVIIDVLIISWKSIHTWAVLRSEKYKVSQVRLNIADSAFKQAWFIVGFVISKSIYPLINSYKRPLASHWELCIGIYNNH